MVPLLVGHLVATPSLLMLLIVGPPALLLLLLLLVVSTMLGPTLCLCLLLLPGIPHISFPLQARLHLAGRVLLPAEVAARRGVHGIAPIVLDMQPAPVAAGSTRPPKETRLLGACLMALRVSYSGHHMLAPSCSPDHTLPNLACGAVLLCFHCLRNSVRADARPCGAEVGRHAA